MNDAFGVAAVKECGERLKLWDDEAFKRRLTLAAERRGMTLAELFAEAGVSRFYLSRPRVGRNTNAILNFARILRAPPGELLGVEEMKAKADIERNRDKLERLSVVARMMAAQLAAMLYVVANNKSQADPAVLMEMVLREFHRDQDGNNDGTA